MSETPRPAWPLRVTQVEIVPGVQKAWLEDQSGRPFLYNADTCWFLCFKATGEEVIQYLDNRRQKGVTVIQSMLLPWTEDGNDSWMGIKAFENDQFDKPLEPYWNHVDWVVKAARERNITLSMALAWSGCCGEGWARVLKNDYHRADDFAALKRYARFVALRYANTGNVMLFLGGDSSDNKAQFAAMAREIKQHVPQMLIAHHPSSWYGHPDTYGVKSATSAGEHGQADYLDISWTYTYWPNQNNRAHSHPYYLNHIEWNRNQNVPSEVNKARPFLLGESGYENERGSAVHRIRRQMHWNIICGAAGHAYGHGSLWKLAKDWKPQLDSPGSVALGHVLDIYSSRPWWRLVPEQPKDEFFLGKPLRIAGARSFIVAGQEMYDNVLSNDEERGQKFVAAARTPEGRLIMAYFPHHYGKPGIQIDMTALAGPARAAWIDPQSAEEHSISDTPLTNLGTRIFTPPGRNSFGDNDWVLVIESGAETSLK